MLGIKLHLINVNGDGNSTTTLSHLKPAEESGSYFKHRKLMLHGN